MKSRLYVALVALLLFNISLVAVSAYMTVRATQQHPMIGQLVDANGTDLHVLDSARDDQPVNQYAMNVQPLTGNHKLSTPIVLIHGASTSLLDFEHAIKPHLQPYTRIISIDRPGHGYSDRGTAHVDTRTADEDTQRWMNPGEQARLIAAALEQLQVEDAVWVGHSWAGSVVLAALLDDQIPARAGVLIAGATHPWEGGSAWHVDMAARPIIGQLFSWQYIQPMGRLAMQGAVASVFAPEQVPDNYVEKTGLVLSLRPRTYHHNAQDRTRLSKYLETQSLNYVRISAPLLSVTGTADSVVPAWNHHDRLIKQVLHTQSLSLQGAGHAPHHTRPEVLANAIRMFISSLPGQP